MSDATGASPDFNDPEALGLERLCEAGAPDWIRQRTAAPGIALLDAWFQGRAYRKHRHDTYAIGVTETGIQAFSYRRATHICVPGEVVVLHPDELHDGYAGAGVGFGYRLIYIEPALIFAAVRELEGPRAALPFARQPVLRDPVLAAVLRSAFTEHLEPLATDDLVVRITQGLANAGSARRSAPAQRSFDLAAIERARGFLDAERNRVVRSEEMEAVSGLSRYDLARQFRAALGTSPYRYSLLRRLDAAREQLGSPQALADIALAAGFADQAHFTRMFVAAFGISPGRYRALAAASDSLAPRPLLSMAQRSMPRTVGGHSEA